MRLRVRVCMCAYVRVYACARMCVSCVYAFHIKKNIGCIFCAISCL